MGGAINRPGIIFNEHVDPVPVLQVQPASTVHELEHPSPFTTLLSLHTSGPAERVFMYACNTWVIWRAKKPERSKKRIDGLVEHPASERAFSPGAAARHSQSARPHTDRNHHSNPIFSPEKSGWAWIAGYLNSWKAKIEKKVGFPKWQLSEFWLSASGTRRLWG